jgi:C-terminal peptidase prc
MSRRLAVLAIALVVAVTSWSATHEGMLGASFTANAQEPASKVDQVFARIEQNKGATLWDDVRDLREAGKAGVDSIRQGFTRADANVRIAAAAAIYATGARDEGVEALLQVAKDSKQDGARPRAAQAAALLTEADKVLTPEQRFKLYGRYMAVAGESDDELVKVHLYRGAYGLTQKVEPRRALLDIFDKPSRPVVKDEAALAIASTDAFQGVRSHLRAMSEQQGDNARQARLWLKYDDLASENDRARDRAPVAAAGGAYALLDEIINKLQLGYYDPKLIEAGARGMLSSLDPYTMFLDKKSLDQLRKEDLEGHYGGIGARVQMRRNSAGVLWLTISEPIFSGPAYKAGLRSNDIITAVDGEDTANRDQDELVRKLRGKPGTDARIKVMRRGWKEAKEFVITRKEVQLETTMSEMLPGEIGYVSYTAFGLLEVEKNLKKSNLETHIKALADKGMKALVLDLRFNTGGYLRTAEQIAGMFLDEGQVILTSKARGKDLHVYKAQKSPDRVKVTVPTIMLVNEFSASASEILAGALQHYKKAVLVGERTFGKGSIQEVKEIELDALLIKDENGNPVLDENGRRQYNAAARITTAKWFLPSGKTVEKERIGEKEGEAGDPEMGKEKKDTGGIDPDIKVTFPERDYWKDSEFEKLRAAGKIEDYVTKEFPANKELFETLAVMDNGDTSKYPGYDALYASLTTKASKEEVRELVREFVRKKVQDERQRAFYMDLQMDVQLQRAIIEACKASRQEAKKIKEYEHFAVAK